jgi:hypothetical protein
MHPNRLEKSRRFLFGGIFDVGKPCAFDASPKMRGGYMRAIYIAILSAITLLILGLWTDHRSIAATRHTEDLCDLVKMAQLVIEAEVIETKPSSASTPVPLTQARIKVVKVLKGTSTESEILIDFAGGISGEQRVIAPGAPELIPGHRYVLLVSRFPQAENWRVVGGDAGQVEIVTAASGTIARRVGNCKFEYYASDARSLTGFTRVRCAEMRESAFSALLRAIIETGRPVIESPTPAVATVAPIQVNAPVPVHDGSSENTRRPAGVRLLITTGVTTVLWVLLRRMGFRRKYIEARCR